VEEWVRRKSSHSLWLVLVWTPLLVAGSLQSAPANATTLPGCPAVAWAENPQHSGFSCTLLPDRLHDLWSVRLNHPTSYPLIADGKVFVTTSQPGGSYGGSLYALDAATGAVAWGPIPLSGTYYFFPLAYDGGKVFVNNFDGKVVAFDATTGAQRWATQTEYFSGVPIATGGTVWLHGSSDVWGLAETDGSVAAQSTYLDGDGSTIAADSTGVYASTGCGSQYKLSLTAQIVWSDMQGCSGGGGGDVSLWRSKMYGTNGNVILKKVDGTSVGSFAGRPAFRHERAFFANGNSVFAEDVKTQVPLWTVSVAGTITAGPITTRGAVWVATASKYLIELSPSTGGVLSKLTLNGVPGGGGEYSGDPSDINAGDGMLVVPTGRTVTAYG
jgi:outer membrane protein assembly factor BamB